MAIYGLRKDNGFIVYDIETKKVIKKYAPGAFPKEIIRYFKSINSKIEKVCAISRKEKQLLEEVINIDSIKI